MTDAFLVVAPDGKLVDHNQAAEGLLPLWSGTPWAAA
jgi:hypothetical protein